MIEKIVNAIGIAPQSVVLLNFWGEDEDRHVLHAFEEAVVAAGAAPLVMQHSRKGYAALFARMTSEVFTERYFEYLAPADVAMDIFMAPPSLAGADIPEAAVPLYRAYLRGMFQRLMKMEKFVQIRMPTAANAQGTGLSGEDFVARMTRAYDIDYEQLRADCAQRIAQTEGRVQAVVHTEGCELVLSLASRSWHMDAGDGDFPCGEVYIAPVEACTNGTVRFETLHLPEGTYHHVVLTIEKGQVVACSDAKLDEYLKSLPEGGRMVGELGLGMNPNVTETVGYPVLDEKMAGTFHLGLGMNLPFGGTNESESHIDLVGKGSVTFLP